MEEKKVFNIVLTGGPCAGKTSALSKLSKKLSVMGYNVLTVAEGATELILSGATIEKLGRINFQLLLMKYLLKKEESYRDIAKFLDKETIILYDRGLLDIKAFVDENTFSKIIKQARLTEKEILNRYDAVIHMLSVANGFESYYTKLNNLARSENVEQAVILDKRTLQVWSSHSNFIVVDNKEVFDDKLEEVFDNIKRIVRKHH